MLTERWRVVEVLDIIEIHKYKTHKIHNSDFHIKMYQFRNNLTRKHLESSQVIGVGGYSCEYDIPVPRYSPAGNV